MLFIISLTFLFALKIALLMVLVAQILLKKDNSKSKANIFLALFI